MIDHVGVGVSNIATSKAFFLKALQPLGAGMGRNGKPERDVVDPPIMFGARGELLAEAVPPGAGFGFTEVYAQM